MRNKVTGRLRSRLGEKLPNRDREGINWLYNETRAGVCAPRTL